MEKKSNGQEFKEKNGYSKSTKRAIGRLSPTNETGVINYISIAEYKMIRRNNKKKIKKVQKEKHLKAAAERMSRPARTKNKGKKQKSSK